MNPLSLSEIMDEALDTLRKYVKSIITFTLGYGFILTLLLIPFIILLGVYFAVVTATGIPFTSSIIIILAISVPLITGISFTLNTGIIKIASQEYLKEDIFASGAIKASFKSIPKVTGIVSIAVIIALPILALFGLIGYSLYKQLEGADFFLGAFGSGGIMLIVMIIAAYLIAFLVITFYCTIYTFSIQAVVIESMGVIASIKRSFVLVKKSFLKIFGYNFLFQLVVAGITISIESFLALLFGLLYLVLQFFNVQENVLALVLIGYTYTRMPIDLVAGLTVYPVWVIMQTKLYFSLRFQREGYDMLLKLKEIRSSAMKESV